MSVVLTEYYGWHLSLGLVEYHRVLNWQHQLVNLRREGMVRDTIITVEHPPVVTVGRDGHPENWADLKEQPVFIERGGDVTYHGPGQAVVYFIFNLARRGKDLHLFMDQIQEGVIRALAEYGVAAERGKENTGVWVDGRKLASIGIAVKHWISFHGVAVNINTELKEFERIHPCGLESSVMTSLRNQLGREVPLPEFVEKLVGHYGDVFETVFTPVSLDELAEDVESQDGGGHV